MLALLYYPAFYYPLLACATVQHRVGYLLGCLLSWCHCVLYIWQKVDCPQTPKVKTEKNADGEKLGRSQLDEQLSLVKPGDFLPIGYIKVLEKFGTPIWIFINVVGSKNQNVLI